MVARPISPTVRSSGCSAMRESTRLAKAQTRCSLRSSHWSAYAGRAPQTGNGKEFWERKLVQNRTAPPAMEFSPPACVPTRGDADLQAAPANGKNNGSPSVAAELFLRGSFRRARRSLAEMRDNDD